MVSLGRNSGDITTRLHAEVTANLTALANGGEVSTAVWDGTSADGRAGLQTSYELCDGGCSQENKSRSHANECLGRIFG